MGTNTFHFNMAKLFPEKEQPIYLEDVVSIINPKLKAKDQIDAFVLSEAYLVIALQIAFDILTNEKGIKISDVLDDEDITILNNIRIYFFHSILIWAQVITGLEKRLNPSSKVVESQ